MVLIFTKVYLVMWIIYIISVQFVTLDLQNIFNWTSGERFSFVAFTIVFIPIAALATMFIKDSK